MRVKQTSVFLENRAGRLDAVARLLGEGGINIRALSLADTSDFGILRMIVDDPGLASEILEENDFTYSLTDVVAVEVPDHPGGLATVLDVLNKDGINVEYMYAFVEKATDQAVMVFRFEDIEQAIESLRRGDINILSGNEIREL